jgi:hypothetical protein
MAITLRLLFDEDTSEKFARLCSEAGHDVRRVVTEPILGRGTGDPTVRTHAKTTERTLVTHDDHHVAAPTTTHSGVFYDPTQRRDSVESYRILRAVCRTIDAIEALPPVVYLTEDWIQ